MTGMARIWAGLLAALACASAAAAAELPSRQGQGSPAPVRRCQIDGRPGLLAGDQQTCVRVGGYVSGGVAAGNPKAGSSTGYPK